VRDRKVSLSAIPGIGTRTISQLTQKLGEKRALEALLQARLPEVASAVGSEKRALRLIKAARASLLGYTPDEVFGTEDAAALYALSISYVASYASSEPARVLILTRSPAPSFKALRLVEETQRYLNILNGIDATLLERLASALKGLTWLRDCAESRRTVIVPDENYKEAVAALSRVKGVKLVKTRDAEETLELLHSYHYGDVVVYVSGQDSGEDIPSAKALTISELAPEALLEHIRCNKSILRAFLDVLELAPQLLGRLSASHGYQLEKLHSAVSRLLEIVETYTAERHGAEYERIRSMLDQLDRVATDIEVWANEEARRRLEKLELRLSAVELLRMLDSIEAGNLRIPEEIVAAIEEVVLEAENRLANRLGINDEEAALVSGIFEASPFLPIRLRTEHLAELRNKLEKRVSIIRLRALQRLAKAAAEHVWALEAAYHVLLELDQGQALARYATRHQASSAALDTSWLGIGLVKGREIDLVKRHGIENVDPVSYAVGCTRYQPEGTRCERVVLLTGANSGGKTTLLKLLAEAVMLAQAGLPAPASQAYVGPFDRVYYISKPTGMLTAGALETLLKKLAAIAEDARTKRVLVLVDELEAVTEANAAARIIASFIEQLLEANAVAVIVTHMAEDILRLIDIHQPGMIRVDGIEAKGLDENYNLIVDRAPRYNYLARSTPELVVKRLLLRSRRPRERKLYEAILSKMSRQ